MATFVAKLSELVEHCEFGDRLEEHLRDRLVCEIADERVKRMLFAEKALTFQKALDMTRGGDGRKNVEEVQDTTSKQGETVQQVSHKVGWGGQHPEERYRIRGRGSLLCESHHKGIDQRINQLQSG